MTTIEGSSEEQSTNADIAKLLKEMDFKSPIKITLLDETNRVKTANTTANSDKVLVTTVGEAIAFMDLLLREGKNTLGRVSLEMDTQLQVLVKNYAEAFKNTWNSVLNITTKHKINAAGFPGGVVLFFEGTNDTEQPDVIAGSFLDIRYAWNAVKGESKIKDEDLQHSFERAANGKWNSDETDCYIYGDGICLIKGNTEDFFSTESVKQDVKVTSEYLMSEVKKTFKI